MTEQLKMLLDELEVYVEDNSDYNLFAAGGYDGDDYIEIVQFTTDIPYILRIKTYARYEEGKVLYFTFDDEKQLINFLEENYG